MKILILEDNYEIAELTMRLLGDHGHTCFHVLNGAAGLEELERSDFDLIVSDVCMPVMDGLSFAVTARKTGLKAPILLFTGEPYVDQQKAIDGGITAVFEKCDLGLMVKTINDMQVSQ